MKIDLKLNIMQLKVLVDTFQQVVTPEESDCYQKAAKSVLSKVILKIKKKQLDELQKVDIFSSKKKNKISMAYHEAFFLYQFLLLIDHNVLDTYEGNVISIIESELNQKLI